MQKLPHGMARLIDGDAEGDIDPAEAEPRIRRWQERLQALQKHTEQLRVQAPQQAALQVVMSRLEEFSAKVSAELEQLDWHGRRELIRTLVKRVEIDRERINVVCRVDESTFPSGNGSVMQDCRRGAHRPLRRSRRWRPALQAVHDLLL